MSDVMLYGVLRMPYDMAMRSAISRRQFYDRAQEAADRIEQLEAELARLRAEAAAPRDETYLFEHWASDPVRADKLPLAKHDNGAYKDTRSYIAFYAWKSRAAQVVALYTRPQGIDPFTDLGENRDAQAYERLRLACVLQQPAPVPDQMALVWRGDIMRMRHDLIRKQAFFDLHRKAAP